ncbi:SDR family oxidoreductase [Pseudonocardia sp. GCM10023141]|uniref:SDR family oxidoreductase n=1 Tax=Pseudonocardia sp. GCM10023141 TaxID=3252653 RepID=UPI00360E69DD
MTSTGGRTLTPGQTAMATFSGGSIMATRALAMELAVARIRVNCVCVTIVRGPPSWLAAFDANRTVSDRHRRQSTRRSSNGARSGLPRPAASESSWSSSLPIGPATSPDRSDTTSCHRSALFIPVSPER